ncbi:MAG TPA: efflux RND transporter periplasmic adaptor subunit [Candidatus Hydrogenedentes bacterium]|nr:efflux RND transporter periplasmic adaptor subunit [Candidatus Hydrogenedentota bacterium]HOL75636.1 efflux RND transporter periplasmic adaptor subunit [Candidatus Hydrogenedentota bacterium]HPO84371.1 efflux RND transporter periplasmic adaptor subunit [Candidatus Hydrogenedentota bacterium]
MKTLDSESTKSTVTQTNPGNRLRRGLGWLLRTVVGLVILSASIALSYYWLANPPKTQRRPSEVEATLVEVTPVHMGTEQIAVQAMGTVTPSREIRLAVLVPGRVVAVSPHFMPGGFFQENEEILRIEEADYQLALRQQQSNLARAEATLKLEMGQQAVAQKEYELVGKSGDTEDEELMLRKPQLASAKASVDAAQAALEKAQLDLERTVLKAPFNCVIQTRSADLGSYVSPGTALATAVGTDTFWVDTSVPVDELKWLQIPDAKNKKGSPARIYYPAAWGSDVFRMGEIIRLLPDLDEGRMARVLVEVQDPLELNTNENQHPLILKSYVRVELLGQEVPNVVKLQRSAVREGNKVWVMSEDSTLDIRSLSIVWSSPDFVLVSDGLRDNDKVVTSSLIAPVQGMPLRVRENSPSDTTTTRQQR